MVFRKKKKTEPIPKEEEVLEVPKAEVVEEFNPFKPVTPEQTPPTQQVEQIPPQPVQQPVQQQVQQVEQPIQQPPQQIETKGMLKILSGEMMEVDGKNYYRYLVLTNKSLGQIGEEFPIE